mgnify:FL=1
MNIEKELKRDREEFLDFISRITSVQNRTDMLLLLANRCIEEGFNLIVELDTSGLYIDHFNNEHIRQKSFAIKNNENTSEAFEYLETLLLEEE